MQEPGLQSWIGVNSDFSVSGSLVLTWISSCITAAIEVDSGFPGGSDGKASAYNVGHRAQSLGQKDPLEKEMATHSSTLAWKIPWMATVHGVAKSRTQLSNFTFFFL